VPSSVVPIPQISFRFPLFLSPFPVRAVFRVDASFSLASHVILTVNEKDSLVYEPISLQCRSIPDFASCTFELADDRDMDSLEMLDGGLCKMNGSVRNWK